MSQTTTWTIFVQKWLETLAVLLEMERLGLSSEGRGRLAQHETFDHRIEFVEASFEKIELVEENETVVDSRHSNRPYGFAVRCTARLPAPIRRD
jgi:hypothetical protein